MMLTYASLHAVSVAANAAAPPPTRPTAGCTSCTGASTTPAVAADKQVSAAATTTCSSSCPARPLNTHRQHAKGASAVLLTDTFLGQCPANCMRVYKGKSSIRYRKLQAALAAHKDSCNKVEQWLAHQQKKVSEGDLYTQHEDLEDTTSTDSVVSSSVNSITNSSNSSSSRSGSSTSSSSGRLLKAIGRYFGISKQHSYQSNKKSKKQAGLPYATHCYRFTEWQAA